MAVQDENSDTGPLNQNGQTQTDAANANSNGNLNSESQDSATAPRSMITNNNVNNDNMNTVVTGTNNTNNNEIQNQNQQQLPTPSPGPESGHPAPEDSPRKINEKSQEKGIQGDQINIIGPSAESESPTDAELDKLLLLCCQKDSQQQSQSQQSQQQQTKNQQSRESGPDQQQTTAETQKPNLPIAQQGLQQGNLPTVVNQNQDQTSQINQNSTQQQSGPSQQSQDSQIQQNENQVQLQDQAETSRMIKSTTVSAKLKKDIVIDDVGVSAKLKKAARQARTQTQNQQQNQNSSQNSQNQQSTQQQSQSLSNQHEQSQQQDQLQQGIDSFFMASSDLHHCGSRMPMNWDNESESNENNMNNQQSFTTKSKSLGSMLWSAAAAATSGSRKTSPVTDSQPQVDELINKDRQNLNSESDSTLNDQQTTGPGGASASGGPSTSSGSTQQQQIQSPTIRKKSLNTSGKKTARQSQSQNQQAHFSNSTALGNNGGTSSSSAGPSAEKRRSSFFVRAGSFIAQNLIGGGGGGAKRQSNKSTTSLIGGNHASVLPQPEGGGSPDGQQQGAVSKSLQRQSSTATNRSNKSTNKFNHDINDNENNSNNSKTMTNNSHDQTMTQNDDDIDDEDYGDEDDYDDEDEDKFPTDIDPMTKSKTDINQIQGGSSGGPGSSSSSSLNNKNPITKLISAPSAVRGAGAGVGFTRKRSLSISIFPSSASQIGLGGGGRANSREGGGGGNSNSGYSQGGGGGGHGGPGPSLGSGLGGRRMSFTTALPAHNRHSTFVDLGSVVEFSRFTFDQFEIRDTETANVNPASTQVFGKVPTKLSIYWRAGQSDLLYSGKKFCSLLAIFNLWCTTFYVSFFHPLVGDKVNNISDDHPTIDSTPDFKQLLPIFHLDIVFEIFFFLFEVLFPLRTSITDLRSGREYVELADIQNMLFRTKEWWFNILSLFGSLLWVDALRESGERSIFCWFGLLRFLRFEAVRRERLETSQTGKIVSPYRQGLWSGVELVICMFFIIHLFATVWYFVLYAVDNAVIYDCHMKHIPLFDFYFLSLRDAVLLFSASPPSRMINRNDMAIVQAINILRPIGSLAEAVIFARIVLIEQRMMILKSKTHESQCAINAAVSQLQLPENLHRRIFLYHQFLEIQHDKQACDLLYHTSSKALALEIKICLFAQLIEKAPFFRDLKPSGVGEIIDNFIEEVFSPGDYIIRFGQEGQEMYFVLRGICDVVVIRRNSIPGPSNPNAIPEASAKLVVASKKTGDYFGETALVHAGQKRTAYVRAQTYTVAEKLTSDCLHRIVKVRYPDAYNQIVYRISQFHQLPPQQQNLIQNTIGLAQAGGVNNNGMNSVQNQVNAVMNNAGQNQMNNNMNDSLNTSGSGIRQNLLRSTVDNQNQIPKIEQSITSKSNAGPLGNLGNTNSHSLLAPTRESSGIPCQQTLTIQSGSQQSQLSHPLNGGIQINQNNSQQNNSQQQNQNQLNPSPSLLAANFLYSTPLTQNQQNANGQQNTQSNTNHIIRSSMMSNMGQNSNNQQDQTGPNTNSTQQISESKDNNLTRSQPLMGGVNGNSLNPYSRSALNDYEQTILRNSMNMSDGQNLIQQQVQQTQQQNRDPLNTLGQGLQNQQDHDDDNSDNEDQYPDAEIIDGHDPHGENLKNQNDQTNGASGQQTKPQQRPFRSTLTGPQTSDMLSPLRNINNNSPIRVSSFTPGLGNDMMLNGQNHSKRSMSVLIQGGSGYGQQGGSSGPGQQQFGNNLQLNFNLNKSNSIYSNVTPNSQLNQLFNPANGQVSRSSSSGGGNNNNMNNNNNYLQHYQQQHGSAGQGVPQLQHQTTQDFDARMLQQNSSISTLGGHQLQGPNMHNQNQNQMNNLLSNQNFNLRVSSDLYSTQDFLRSQIEAAELREAAAAAASVKERESVMLPMGKTTSILSDAANNASNAVTNAGNATSSKFREMFNRVKNSGPVGGGNN